MDNAVALARAYPQLNGYFTITEYPVVRKTGDGSFRTLTEVDVAAFHLPHGEPDFEPDPALILRPLVRSAGSRDPIFGVMVLLAKARARIGSGHVESRLQRAGGFKASVCSEVDRLSARGIYP